MRIQTRGNSTTVWLSSGEGVIDGSMSLSAPTLEKILQAVNEKYGTSFESWSQLPTAYEVGGTVPNWNAYEKILLPAKEYFRFNASGSSAYLTGFVQGENAFLNTNSSNAVWNVSPEGSVWAAGGPVSNYSAQAKQLLLNEYGKEFDVINAFVENWEQGQTVPNWDSYTLIS